jgi:hypothetical protein
MIKLIVNNGRNNEEHDDSPSEMRPNVDGFIMKLKKTFQNLAVRVKINSITHLEFVISHVFWRLFEFISIGGIFP